MADETVVPGPGGGTGLAADENRMVPSMDLSPSDAAILALIAENPHMPKDEFDRLIEELGSEAVVDVARALVDDRDAATAAARETARSIRDWVESNKRGTATSARRSP